MKSKIGTLSVHRYKTPVTRLSHAQAAANSAITAKIKKMKMA